MVSSWPPLYSLIKKIVQPSQNKCTGIIEVLLLPEKIESFRCLAVLGDPINTADMLCKLPTKWTCKSWNIDTGFHFLLHPRLQKSTECDCLLWQHGLNLSGQIEGTRENNVTFCASAHNSPLQEITPWD